MTNSTYNTLDFRSSITSFLKADRQNSQRLKKSHPDFLMWLTLTYPALNKSEALYRYLFGEPTSTDCQVCGNHVRFNGLWKGYAQYCSYACSNKHEAKQQKVKATLLENYGVDNPSKNEDIQKKKVDTSWEKYGARHFMVSDDGKATYMKVIQEKYGTDWFVQTSEFQTTYTSNSIEKYGVNRPQQTGEYWENSKPYGYKEYITTSNDVVMIQGYDGFLIDYLLSLGHGMDDIVYKRSDVPNIAYELAGNRIYFPDAYVAKTNTVYEAKSEWTFNQDKERIMIKIEATKASGFNLVCIIFDNTGKVLSII